jgi:hypothetical protein
MVVQPAMVIQDNLIAPPCNAFNLYIAGGLTVNNKFLNGFLFIKAEVLPIENQ